VRFELLNETTEAGVGKASRPVPSPAVRRRPQGFPGRHQGCQCQEESMSRKKPPPPQYPIGTVALYGPDDKTTTKIAAGVILHENAKPIVERWVGTNVKDNPKFQQQMQQFFVKHGVKTVVATDRNMGCPHEEGEDFPTGEDCPFCPFWKGKQGSARRS